MTDEPDGTDARAADRVRDRRPGRAASVARRLPALTWLRAAFLGDMALGVAWSLWRTRGLQARLLKDTLLFLVGPGVSG